jgi:AsmA protein
LGRRLSIPQGVFSMDANSAAGTLALTFGDLRPAVAGTLAFETLDLTPYLVADIQEPEASLMGQFKVARDLTLPLLGLIDSDVRLSAEKITLGGIQAQNGAASLSLREGQMLLTVVDVGVKDSHMHGEIAIEGSTTTPNYKVRGGFKNGDMSEATIALVGTALLRGRGDVDVDLTASGSAGLDVLSKLSGKIRLGLPDGGAAACSLKGLMVAAEAGEQDVSHPCQSYTSLGPVKADATLTSGIVRIDHFETAAGPDPLRLSGTLDLVTRIMDVTVSSNPPAPDQARDLVTVRGRPETPTYGRRKKLE